MERVINLEERRNKLKGTYVIFSDIQGSFDYLDRFFNATKNMKKNGSICLGDIVHRFTDFSDNRCIEAVKNNADYCVRGNHEDELSKKSKEKIFPENLDYVIGLPKVKNLGEVLLFHSSISEEGHRLRSKKQIQNEGKYIIENYPGVRFALFGHTHRKGAYTISRNEIKSLKGDNVQLDLNGLNLINPGGIGLKYNLEKTFARVNFDNGELNFFTLEQAEDMSNNADIVNTFDTRWMPSINKDSYKWFLQYAKNDTSYLMEKGKEDRLLEQLAKRLNSFDAHHFEKIGESKKKIYLEEYSLGLAGDVDKIREKVSDFYHTKDPFESRKEYLILKRKRY